VLLDWSKLKPYHSDKRLSFEEFCYQISKCQYQDGFTRIDDTGGGDGVEYYRRLPNGEEWGWQAKFYYPNLRLNVSNRKSQIQESLVTSCKNHPRLKKWILCTPANFTVDESSWFAEELVKKIPNGMTVQLEHWGDSEFNYWVSQPNCAGIRNYFFGELELTADWFKQRFDEISEVYKDKFNPDLHTSTRRDTEIQDVLAEPILSQELHEILNNVDKKFEGYVKSLDDLRSPISRKIDWGTAKDALVKALESNRVVLDEARSIIRNLCQELENGLLENTRSWNLSTSKDFLNSIRESIKTCNTLYSKFDVNDLSVKGEKKEEKYARDEAARIVREPIGYATEIAEQFSAAARLLESISRSNINIVGGPGVGKTHLVAHIVDDRRKAALPAVLIPGSRFISTQQISQQLLSMLHIPANYSWDDFLSALDSCAQSYRTRIPLIIDGLNETRANGAISDIWKLELPALIKQIEQVKNVVLITTCRTTYEQAIWSSKKFPNRFYLYELGTQDVNLATQKYFAWYKIRGDLTTSSLSQFRNPLYLKIFCETNNPQREQEKEVYVGEQTLFETFDAWLVQCSQSICDRLNLHKSVPTAQESIRRIALRLWDRHTREVSIAELAEIVDNKPLKELQWEGSWSKAILDEGLLVCTDFRNGGEVAYFTYDLLGGYLIATNLVESGSLEAFLKSQTCTDWLFSDDLKLLHPLHEDIVRSLAVVLPTKTGRFLHEVRDDQRAFSASINGIFEVPPKVVSQDCVATIAKLFRDEPNRRPLLNLASYTMTHTKHPLNSIFWSEQLHRLAMAERDLCWTEYVRETEDEFQSIVARFEAQCMAEAAMPASSLTKERSLLMAHQLMWILTSTCRGLRDRATRALYWYGRANSDTFFDLVISSLAINDPYVPERMLAAAYGVAMARQIEFTDHTFVEKILPMYGERLYDAMFKENSPYGTTHILTRDYARRTIELALSHSDFLDAKQRQRIHPPFSDGGIRKWGESEDKDDEKYRDGNAPIHMDFGNYTMGRLIRDRSNYDYENPEYKAVHGNIFWRMYDLGYSLERFGEIDKIINEMNWSYRGEESGKIDRYGKKYSWIAFFELAGYRQDKNLLPADDSRISDCDVDPSFPERVQQYQISVSDWLELDSCTTEDWISKTNAPDTSSILVIPKMLGIDGPWVLLNGLIRQENLKAYRDCFLWLNGIVVKNSDLPEFQMLLTKDAKTRIPDAPTDYYTYAGEIPWCDTFPLNGEVDIDFVVETKKELRSIPSIVTGDLIEQEIEIPSKVRTFHVFIPIRENCYESYHSEVNLGRSVSVPAREISESLDLCCQPETFDLYQKDGRKASITLEWGEPYHNSQLTFLRRDLLDKFLSLRGMSLAWNIEGERRLWSKEKGDFTGPGIEKYTSFFQVLPHTPSKA
jgi:hypothetical protein